MEAQVFTSPRLRPWAGTGILTAARCAISMCSRFREQSAWQAAILLLNKKARTRTTALIPPSTRLVAIIQHFGGRGSGRLGVQEGALKKE